MFSSDTKVLIIDDMQAIRELVKKHLRGFGFQNITEAVDGEEGLFLLTQHQLKGQPFQLVISDWNMPKIEGVDLLKLVRAKPEFLNLPFLLLTSESERDQVTEAVLAGVSQYVVKPFSAKTLEDKLRVVWQKHNAVK